MQCSAPLRQNVPFPRPLFVRAALLRSSTGCRSTTSSVFHLIFATPAAIASVGLSAIDFSLYDLRMMRERSFLKTMAFIRIIAAVAFAFHILVGCGSHQHSANAAGNDDQFCSAISHGDCHAGTESPPAGEHSSPGNPDDCEVVACVYVSAPQVEVPAPTQVSVISTVPPEYEYDAGIWSRHELNAGELLPPHVRRHVALLYFLN